MTPIEIPLSKKKLVLLLLGTAAFVAIGVWFVTNPPQLDDVFWDDPRVMIGLGIFCIAFFLFAGVITVRKLVDKRPGFVIDDMGIVDNSSGVAGGRILWSEIDEFSKIDVFSQKLIGIHLKDPKAYLDRQTGMRKKTMQLNFKTYNAPVHISANTLQVSYKELLELLNKNFSAYKLGADK